MEISFYRINLILDEVAMCELDSYISWSGGSYLRATQAPHTAYGHDSGRSSSTYSLVELYPGVGGIRWAWEEILNLDVLYSYEPDPWCRHTYVANFGEMVRGGSENAGEWNQDYLERLRGVDLLTVTLPVESISVFAQLLRHTSSRRSATRDAQLEQALGDVTVAELGETQLGAVVRVVQTLRPHCIYCDQQKHQRNSAYELELIWLGQWLEAQGYAVQRVTYKLSDWGLVQRRQRSYLIAFLRDAVPNYAELELPRPAPRLARLGDFLERWVDKKYTLRDASWKGHQRRHELSQRKGNGFGYNLYSPYDSSIQAFSTRYHRNDDEVLIAQPPYNPRRLTPREMARLQGLDDAFVLPCSDTRSYRQLAQAVAVPVARELGRAIGKVLARRAK